MCPGAPIMVIFAQQNHIHAYLRAIKLNYMILSYILSCIQSCCSDRLKCKALS